MGVIKIQDSGYIKPDNSGSQATTDNRSNSGDAITLKVATFSPSLTRNISVQPELATSTPSEVNLGSLENMKFVLDCKLDTGNSTDMGNIQHLLDLLTTDGYKFMWYDYSGTAENNNGQLLYRICLNSNFGNQFSTQEQTDFTVSSDYYHLHVHFFDIQPRHDANSKIIAYRLTGVVLKTP